MVTNKSEENCQNRETSRNQEIEQKNTKMICLPSIYRNTMSIRMSTLTHF